MARGTDAVVVVKKQASKGTAATFAGTEFGLPLVSESMQATPTIYGSQALRKRALRTRNLARLGTLDVNGSLELEATNRSLHDLLPLIFPVMADDPDTVTYDAVTDFSRTYSLNTNDELDYFTMQVWDGEVNRQFVDCRVNSANIQADINQLARLSLDVPGISASVNTSAPTGNIPTVEYGLYFEEATVKFGAAESVLAEVAAQTINVNFAKNLDTGRYQLGSRFKRNLPGGMWDITGSVTLDANPLTSKTALYTSVLNSEWMAIELTFTDTVNKVSGNNSIFQVSLPYVLIEWPQHNISGPDFIQGAINFTAYDDITSAPEVLHQYTI